MRLVLGYTKNGEVIVLHVNHPRIEGVTDRGTHFYVPLLERMTSICFSSAGIAGVFNNKLDRLKLVYTTRDPKDAYEIVLMYSRSDNFWLGVTYYGQFRPYHELLVGGPVC